MESPVHVRQTLFSSSSAYTVLEFIGEGSFAKVAKCLNVQTKETVAVKILKKNSTAVQEAAEREIAILDLISVRDPDHINVVKLLEKFEHAGQTCLVFEMLDTDLYDLIDIVQPLFLNAIRPIAQQLLVALDALKGLGIIHTDIKPDNVMLVGQSDPFRVKLIDFGQALPLSLLQRGMICQPKGYRAPEVYLGLPFNEAIDVWGLGCLLASLYLGDNAFPSCDYQVMKSMIQFLGQPEDYLLNAGEYTRNFFTKNDGETDSPTWRLLTPKEYRLKNGVPPQKYDCRIKLPSSLDALAYIYPVDEPAELEDRLAFVDLLKGLMNLDGALRISPSQALQHPFITMTHLDKHSYSSDYPIMAREMMETPPNQDQESAFGAEEDVRAPCTWGEEKESEDSHRDFRPPGSSTLPPCSYNNVPVTQSCDGALRYSPSQALKYPFITMTHLSKHSYSSDYPIMAREMMEIPPNQDQESAFGAEEDVRAPCTWGEEKESEDSHRDFRPPGSSTLPPCSYNNVPVTQSCDGALRISPSQALQHPFSTMTHLSKHSDSSDYPIMARELMEIPPNQDQESAFGAEEDVRAPCTWGEEKESEDSHRDFRPPGSSTLPPCSYNNVPVTQSCDGALRISSSQALQHPFITVTHLSKHSDSSDYPIMAREMMETPPNQDQESAFGAEEDVRAPCTWDEEKESEDSHRDFRPPGSSTLPPCSYNNVPVTQSCDGAQAQSYDNTSISGSSEGGIPSWLFNEPLTEQSSDEVERTDSSEDASVWSSDGALSPCSSAGNPASLSQSEEEIPSCMFNEEVDPFPGGAEKTHTTPPPSTISSRTNNMMKRIRRFFRGVQTAFCCCCPVEDD